MRERRLSFMVIMCLLLGGVCAGTARFRIRQHRKTHPSTTVWRLRYDIAFITQRPGTKVRVHLPAETSCCRIIRQEMWHPGLRAVAGRYRRTGSPYVALSAQEAGHFQATVQLDLQLNPRSTYPSPSPSTKLNAKDRDHFLRAEPHIETSCPLAESHIADLRQEGLISRRDLAAAVFGLCADGIAPLSDSPNTTGERALKQGLATPLGQARALAMLSRTAKIPARLVTGFELKPGTSAKPHTWVELFIRDRWLPYDPLNGFAGTVPPRYIPVRRDGTVVCEAGEPRSTCTAAFDLVKIRPPHGLNNMAERRPADILDLTRLPLGLRETLSVLLLLPLGALLTSLLRNMVGVRTFGTFTPTLLALSFIHADWRIGAMAFCALMLLGLTARTFLDSMKLLMVPRLSIILTAAVLAMVFGASYLDYASELNAERVVLLPLVILTMLVERFHIAEEEDGGPAALRLMALTVGVAACCFAVLSFRVLGHWLLIYPETHCLTLAALILIGRYRGYRLTELWRFRDLSGAPRPPEDIST